jgi:hypothetical protein
MNVPVTIAVGAAMGFLGAVTVYFDARVPNKLLLVAAGTLKGVLVGLLTGFSLSVHSGWLVAAGFGALYGVLSGTVVVLSKGAGALQHAVYILPSAVITGTLTGILIAWLAP